jgi:transposase
MSPASPVLPDRPSTSTINVAHQRAVRQLDDAPSIMGPNVDPISYQRKAAPAGWIRYTSHAFREHVWDLGARPAIPPQKHEAPVACPGWVYHNRNRVERLWARLKEWRAVATRYEKTARSFMGVLCLAAALDWLRH